VPYQDAKEGALKVLTMADVSQMMAEFTALTSVTDCQGTFVVAVLRRLDETCKGTMRDYQDLQASFCHVVLAKLP